MVAEVLCKLGEYPTTSIILFRQPPKCHKFEECCSLPFYGIFLTDFVLEEILQKLKICEKSSTQCPQTIKEQSYMVVLVMLEVFQQNLYNQFRLLPLTVVNAVTLAVFLLVGGLVVPQGPDGLDQLLLAGDPVRAPLGQQRSEPHRPELDLGLLGGVGGVRRVDAELHQLVGARSVPRHHRDQLLRLLLQPRPEHLPLLVLQQVLHEAGPLAVLAVLLLQEDVQGLGGEPGQVAPQAGRAADCRALWTARARWSAPACTAAR